MAKFNVKFTVNGYFTTTIEASSEEEAEQIAYQMSSALDICSELDGVYGIDHQVWPQCQEGVCSLPTDELKEKA